jgi:hypothetical protein
LLELEGATLSSGILYFIPNRKVTAWTEWSFLGLDKQQWDNLHINLGMLFLVLMIWHIYFNWKAIKSYLKEKKKFKIFTKEFNGALILVTLFTAGTITMTLPFSIFVNIGNGIKAINALEDGNPPFGYAEYSTLEDFCTLTSLDINETVIKLKSKKIQITSTKEILKSIAKNNNISPKKIFIIIKAKTTKFELPNDIPIGIAHKSLKRLSLEYHINTGKAINHLEYYGIKASLDTNFKKIAMRNNLHPAELYNMILASQKKK